MKKQVQKLDATPSKRIFYSIIADYDLNRSICELVDNGLDVWVTHLEVENTGGQAHDVGVKISSFIVVDRYSTPRTKTIVPLTGYYFAHFNMHKSQGLLFVAEGFNSNKKFGDVYNFFLSDEAKKKYGYVEIWVQNVVWVEYTTRTEKRKKVQFIQNERAADTDVSKYFNAEQAGRKASLLFRYWPHHG